MESKNEMDILLEWLSPDREKAENLYIDLRRKLVSIFKSSDDAEDLVAEAIQRALKNIKAGKVDFSGNPYHYIAKIVRHVKLEEYRKNKTQTLDEGSKESATTLQDEGGGFSEELYQIIEECLDELTAKDKQLFLDYTFVPEGVQVTEYRQKLMKDWDITLTNLRVKIFRIRRDLRSCADKKLGGGQRGGAS
jgi:RNA polymerase sigma factor (sigma-70 family)